MTTLFTVFDTETTGFRADGTDRIVEIGLVVIDEDGVIIDRWETLVNPNRDLGPQHIHGITGRDIHLAPTFADIADELAWRFAGTVPVAHNYSFDRRFIAAEFARVGMAIPRSYLDLGLCTKKMARSLPGGSGNDSLVTCCQRIGYHNAHAHSAGSDADAAAHLLAHYMLLAENDAAFRAARDALRSTAWSPRAPERPAITARRAGAHELHSRRSFVERLTKSEHGDVLTSEAEREYLTLLDSLLLDRVVSAHEEDQLLSQAAASGIDQSHAMDLHARYLQRMVHVALTDAILTPQEERDLQAVARLLGLSSQVLTDLLASSAPSGAELLEEIPAHRGIEVGMTICLTGEMLVPRDELANALIARGFHIHPGVTKKVGLLVAADPDSRSGKARKARDYGIPVVGESFVWEVLLAR